MFQERTKTIGEKCMDYEVEGVRPRGITQKMWRKVVVKDCWSHQVNKENAVTIVNGEKLIEVIV